MKSISFICKKRLAGDLKLLRRSPLENIDAYPDENNVLLWYFLVKGLDESDYEGGYYLGKIIHNKDYPFKPPDFMMLTPNGRFLTDKKICISNSSYHSSEWSSSWTIRAILIGFLSIWMDDKEHGISHIHRSSEERKNYAKASINFNKTSYGNILCNFPRFLTAAGDPLSLENGENNTFKLSIESSIRLKGRIKNLMKMLDIKYKQTQINHDRIKSQILVAQYI